MAIQLNPFFWSCPESSACGKSDLLGWASTTGRAVGSALGFFVARYVLKKTWGPAYLACVGAGLFIDAQFDAKTCASKACGYSGPSALSGHFPMPEFMMPTYFEQETQLLDPRRG